MNFHIAHRMESIPKFLVDGMVRLRHGQQAQIREIFEERLYGHWMLHIPIPTIENEASANTS
jgi:hypothetical protein